MRELRVSAREGAANNSDEPEHPRAEIVLPFVRNQADSGSDGALAVVPRKQKMEGGAFVGFCTLRYVSLSRQFKIKC